MTKFNFTRKDIVARIGYFRNKKNISAYNLSLMLGHCKNYMYRVESGDTNLTIETLLQILEILEISTFEFFYPDTGNFEHDIKDLKILKSLSNEERSSLMTILKIKK